MRTPYQKNFHPCFNLIERCFNANENNLFEFIYNSVAIFKDVLGLRAQLVVSSSIACDHSLNSAERVKAICTELGAESYINPVGGEHLYERDDFQKLGINLRFFETKDRRISTTILPISTVYVDFRYLYVMHF